MIVKRWRPRLSRLSVSQPWDVWRFTDGKPGHDNQSLGLVDALAELVEVRVTTLGTPAPGGEELAPQKTSRYSAWKIARKVWQGETEDLVVSGGPCRPPQVAMGAGHGTHLGLLATGWRTGARTVVLMKPTLPRACFSACLIPRHDGVGGANVLGTWGALNRIRPKEQGAGQEPTVGLILLGGRSRHFRWEPDSVRRQVLEVIQAGAGDWLVADSRRTPAGFLKDLGSHLPRGATTVPHGSTDAGWLPQALEVAHTAWVTEDSVSMVYESLSAGAATGLLELPSVKRDRGRGEGRLGRGLEDLVKQGMVVRYSDWRGGVNLSAPAIPLAEAARCARWLVDRWT